MDIAVLEIEPHRACRRPMRESGATRVKFMIPTDFAKLSRPSFSVMKNEPDKLLAERRIQRSPR